MKKLTLCYRYTKPDGEGMVYVCQIHPPAGMTMRMIKERVRSQIERQNGGPCCDLELIRQNDPFDILMVEATE